MYLTGIKTMTGTIGMLAFNNITILPEMVLPKMEITVKERRYNRTAL